MWFRVGFPRKDLSRIIKSGVPWRTIRMLRDSTRYLFRWFIPSLCVYWVDPRCLLSLFAHLWRHGPTTSNKPLRTRTHAHSPHSNRSTQHTMGDVGSLQWSGSSFAGRSTSAQHISAPCSQILFGWAFPWPLLWWQPMFCTSVFKYILWTAMAPPRFRYTIRQFEHRKRKSLNPYCVRWQIQN